MTHAIVWFKRDLRTVDHAALHAACQHTGAGSVRCVYVIEPALWQQPDAAAQHWAFVRECLRDLDVALRRLGASLWVLQGEATEVFGQLWQAQPFTHLYAHEETGNAWTYERDKAVARWCRAQGVHWHELPQFGVVRALRNRSHWQAHWEAFMARPVLPACPLPIAGPALAPPFPAVLGHIAPQPIRGSLSPLPPAHWPGASDLGLTQDDPPHRQRGGRRAALAVLDDFLHERCGQYRGGISSPLSAPTACSRLSPYLALGCLSMKEVVQATQARMQALAAVEARLHNTPEHPDATWARRQHAGLSNFLSRLYWHCHFIQKLESEPALEWRNLHRGYDGLREPDFNPVHFAALTQGRTGWPLVDACVAMLRETGWLNFRMRAMLVSVAAYPLWLHWRPVGEWLARQFLDYEPGIHWSQLQMQSGTTGINTTRVYNPIKQAHDHDPQGHFVRRWLPAMRRVPPQWLFEPWKMPRDVQAACGLCVGADARADIPLPVVDLATATREAKARLHALRAQPEVRAEVGAIVHKHGSRLNRDSTRAARRGARLRSPQVPEAPAPQLSLDF